MDAADGIGDTNLTAASCDFSKTEAPHCNYTKIEAPYCDYSKTEAPDCDYSKSEGRKSWYCSFFRPLLPRSTARVTPKVQAYRIMTQRGTCLRYTWDATGRISFFLAVGCSVVQT